MTIPHALIEAVATNRVVPLIGAGVSVGVKRGLFPTWKQLMDKLADELAAQALTREAERTRALIKAEDYVQAAEVGLSKLGAYRFNRFLREQFRIQRPDDLDLAAVKAIWQLRPPLVVTTNYDAVMRWGCPVGDVQIVANDQAEELALLHEASSEWPWLWYLHGTIDRLSTLILAGSDYKRLYGGEGDQSNRYERAIFELNSQLARQPFLYIGFSLNDPYVMQQITDVLKLTKGKNAPSFALMKRGEGDAAALWAHYNIQLIEYEDHGPPLVALLQELRTRAFPSPTPPPIGVYDKLRSRAMGSHSHGPDPSLLAKGLPSALTEPAPAPPPSTRSPSAPPRPAPEPTVKVDLSTTSRTQFAKVRRHALEREYAEELRRSRRLLVLSPRGGGARTLARHIAEQFGEERVSWLEPPNVPSCTEQEYFAALSDQPEITDSLKLGDWLKGNAARAGGDHLIVVRHDGGPLDHLQTLGNALRSLIEENTRGPFFVLAAGEARCAWLRFNTPSFSLFSGAPVRHVPSFTVAEVAEVLTQTGYREPHLAALVHAATGGHPGMIVEVASTGEGLHADDVVAALTARLSRSPSVRGQLKMRLADDDRSDRSPRTHARQTLLDLLAGATVKRLDHHEDDLNYPEIRLYYDGLVVADAAGQTVFRCPAVRRSAREVLGAGEG